MPITSATLVVKDVYNGGKSYTFEVSADVDRTDQNTNTALGAPPLAHLRSLAGPPPRGPRPCSPHAAPPDALDLNPPPRRAIRRTCP